MLHDVGLHNVIGGHRAYIHRKKDLFRAHRILHQAQTTRCSHDASGLRARRDYKLASWEQKRKQLGNCTEQNYIEKIKSLNF